jgi:hypothetical protein
MGVYGRIICVDEKMLNNKCKSHSADPKRKDVLMLF